MLEVCLALCNDARFNHQLGLPNGWVKRRDSSDCSFKDFISLTLYVNQERKLGIFVCSDVSSSIALFNFSDSNIKQLITLVSDHKNKFGISDEFIEKLNTSKPKKLKITPGELKKIQSLLNILNRNDLSKKLIQNNATLDDIKNILETYKCRFGKALVTEIKEKFEGHLKGMECAFTGIGVSGCFAQLFAYDLQKHAFSIDSPGNKELLETFYIHKKPSLEQEAPKYLHVFLTSPNVENTLGEHIGDLYRIKLALLENSSWRRLIHVGLSLLDIVYVIFFYAILTIAIYKIYCEHAAYGLMLEKQTELDSAVNQTAVWEDAQFKYYSDYRTMEWIRKHAFDDDPIPPKNSGVSYAQESLEKAQEIYSTENWEASLAISVCILYVSFSAILNYYRSVLSVSNINELYKLASNKNTVCTKSLVSVASWPKTPKETWRQILLSIIWPQRFWYILDEKEYLETKIRKLPEYKEDLMANLPEIGSLITESEIINLSNKNISPRTLRLLLVLEMERFSLLRQINLSSNFLDDSVIDILFIPYYMRQFVTINLANNSITIQGLIKLVGILENYPRSEINEVDLSNNKIAFDSNDSLNPYRIDGIYKIKGDGHDNKLSKTVIKLSANIDKRNEDRITVASHTLFSQRGNIFKIPSIFSSFIPKSSSQFVSKETSLIFIIITGGVMTPHSSLLIERVNDNNLRELIVYELKADSNRAYWLDVVRTDLDYSSQRIKKILNKDGSVSIIPCCAINKTKEKQLLPHLDAYDLDALNREYEYNTFGQHNIFTRSRNKKSINCASWIVENLKTIGIEFKLGCLNSPRGFLDQRPSMISTSESYGSCDRMPTSHNDKRRPNSDRQNELSPLLLTTANQV